LDKMGQFVLNKEALKISGGILLAVLNRVIEESKIGISTKELAVYAEEEVKKLGGKPAFLGFGGYPAVICISVNEQVVHGLPNNYRLKDGDVVGFDFGVDYQGMITDAARTIIVGNKTGPNKRLVDTTRVALNKGIDRVKPGARIGDVSQAIQHALESKGFSVVKDLVGHGVGKSLHEEPNIPNYGLAGEGPTIKKDQVLAIEPMSTNGSSKIITLADGWTIATADGSMSAHFEDTVLVVEDGAEILTR